MDAGLLDWWPNTFIVHNAVTYAGGNFDSDGDWYYSPLASWDGFHWNDVFDGWDPTIEANALAHFVGLLFLGGDFTFDAPDPDIENFCAWDGEDLIDYGFYNGDTVDCMQVHGNALYFGGSFTSTGSTGSTGLAWLSDSGFIHPVAQPDVPRQVVDLDIWDSALLVCQRDAVIPYNGAWSDTLGGVFDGELTAVCTIGIDLYAAGSFAGSVVRWDRWWDEWVQVGGSPGNMNHASNYVRAMCRYDGHLIAGGELMVPSVLAGESHCGNIGIWDGEAWHRLGGGLNATVYDIVSYGGDLIAAGHFDYAGGAPAAHLARWDGSSWHVLGDPDGDVNALAVWNGELIVGGSFHHVGGVSAERVAAWDGADWRALGSGFNYGVNDLLVHEGELYAGGIFGNSGGVPVERVARWDGAQWQPLGAGTDNIVYALGSHGGDLYAGGYFTHAGGAAAEGIARWNGAAWHPLGAGVGGAGLFYKVATLASVAGELYVGGDFTEAGGAPAAGIAVWDGAAWREYEGGVQSDGGYVVVHDLQIHEGDLYLGGNFSSVGGRGEVSYNLARWVDGTLVPVFLQDFAAAWIGAQVELSWRVEPAPGTREFRLDARSDSATWSVPYRAVGDGSYVADDAPPRTDSPQDVTYVLSYLDEGAPAPVQLESRTVELPPLSRTRLDGAHPNPFNPGTTVSFTLARAGRVDLAVYDTTGRRVAVLAGRSFMAGEHEVSWDGQDDRGRAAASGAYLVRLETEMGAQSAKIVLVR